MTFIASSFVLNRGAIITRIVYWTPSALLLHWNLTSGLASSQHLVNLFCMGYPFKPSRLIYPCSDNVSASNYDNISAERAIGYSKRLLMSTVPA